MQLSSEKEGNTVIYNNMDEPGESVYVYGHSAVSSSLQPHGLCSPPESSVHGILQARILEWVDISFSRGSSQPWD